MIGKKIKISIKMIIILLINYCFIYNITLIFSCQIGNICSALQVFFNYHKCLLLIECLKPFRTSDSYVPGC